MANQYDHQACEILIVGASFAGLALARALSRTSQGALSIVVVDARQFAKPTGTVQDARAFALSAASRYLLEHISIWPECAPDAQSVEKIEITDSSLEAGVRPVLLAWDNVLENGDPASYIVPAQTVLTALDRAVEADPAIRVLRGVNILGCKTTDYAHTIAVTSSETLNVKLMVAADGKKSALRQQFGLQTVSKSYSQRGIVTTIRHTKAHDATAVQHFLPGGPFAILPLKDNQSCITWSEDENEAQRIMALDASGFKTELDQRLAGRMGDFEVLVQPQTWPLSMHLARDYVADRFALVGDAAHGVHPLAGQGLNLGLRDVAALVDVVLDAARLGLDFGRQDVLQRYEQWRRSDSAMNAFAYDSVNALFSNDVSVFRSLREVGLGSIDRLQGLKRVFVTEAAGQSGDIPTLMRKDAA